MGEDPEEARGYASSGMATLAPTAQGARPRMPASPGEGLHVTDQPAVQKHPAVQTPEVGAEPGHQKGRRSAAPTLHPKGSSARHWRGAQALHPGRVTQKPGAGRSQGGKGEPCSENAIPRAPHSSAPHSFGGGYEL